MDVDGLQGLGVGGSEGRSRHARGANGQGSWNGLPQSQKF